MLDIETLGTGPDALILTIAAQSFDPLGTGFFERKFYARIDFESQQNRTIESNTVEWWSNQNKEAQNEALSEEERIPLSQALDELGKLIWQSQLIWANGTNFDIPVLEHAYKSYSKPLPWQFYKIRDARTVYSLWPDLPRPPTSHHALEDCRRQIELLQHSLKHLNVKELR